ncbi:hypothetical protein EKO27_g4303 [Xylaria grammica]|uniref:Uncharacterized protein n=1 Tax=Xylaria grammica TaxID=363999 RepID=A0A439D8Q3_9PEZI|nr:hypothetical protein EKO27_g4303 [Xylaria grammica]
MEKRNADEPRVLGRLFAATINQQAGLEKLYKLTSSLDSEQGFAVEGMLRKITVSIDGLARPVTWWAETTTAVAHDEWIETSTENGAKVLIPMIEAWKARLQSRTMGHAITSSTIKQICS